MRNDAEHLEKWRITLGPMASDASLGMTGMFSIRRQCKTLLVMASEGMGWEHVSVSLRNRCPTWNEMCLIKRLFWTDDETVIQYHPATEQYVNQHRYCLHLWRPIGVELPVPPAVLVGIKEGMCQITR